MFKEHVKHWLEAERSYGHLVLPQDLYEEFCAAVQKSITQLEGQTSRTAAQQLRLRELQDRLLKLMRSKNYQNTFKDSLLKYTGGRLRRPQRVTELTFG